MFTRVGIPCFGQIAALAALTLAPCPCLLEAGQGAEHADRSAIPQPARTTPTTFISSDGSLDLDAVVKHFEDLYRAGSSIASAELTISRPRRSRSLRMNVRTQGEDRALILIQAPPREKGTATLKVDDNLWNYLPRIRRTIRIPPSMMLSSWMGSDFT
ncbi:MAG: outer membrane lipoprotein-sorting protein, partial [Lentisphaerae bacterium]|nr:outer membrane lipoprotein-sorting protein [Lentisphaerota bacterium]